ncbi:COP9 signalosome complex subunit 3 [Hirsutella rhossiliensis]|uniref:COP9 signalosome complex subunit 3 n=1 Tax=Hirsutella rhossiliensis TaxID=111463 RepID=A0A9P8MTL9_9HYPO|nr:COP9 signalosome complex subunit 3 [Hirsutella rhossiliensis]KAH0961918.1 COP9 signalosome complex subunit 3 [Hirsutella rhossiliensis]
MEEARRTLKSFPPALGTFETLKQYDLAIKQHVSALGKLSKEAQAAMAANPVAILQTLAPADNSIGYLTVLDIAHGEKTEPSAQVLDMTLEFFLNFDVCQVRYVGAMFSSLLEKVGSGAIFPPKVAVELLVAVILRLDPSGSIFTSTHLVLAKLAYASSTVERALPVLDADILFYPAITSYKETRHYLCDPDLPSLGFLTPATGLTEQLKSATVLEYNFLCGMLYISRRDWSKALAAFEQVISHPSRNKGVSKIMAEAHKKWLLVGLLHQGKTPRPPSYTSPTAQASYQTTSEAYMTFASLFNTDKVGLLRTEFDTNRQAWEEDGNASLAAEAMSAYQKWQIINLRQVYLRVSISEVRRTTLNAETGEPLADDQATLALVRDMIESGMLLGLIQTGRNDGESYLAFGNAQNSMSEVEFAKEVARSQQSIEFLSTQYRLTNERLSANKDYLRHLIRDQKRSEMDKEADAAIGFETQIEDEDLMTGVLAHA